MKFIDVSDLGNLPKHFEVQVPASEIRLDMDNVRLLDEVAFVTDAVRTEAEVNLKGRIGYRAEIDCIRCLKPVDRASDIVFDINYVMPEHFASTKEHEVQRADLETDVLNDDRIDIAEVVREQVLLDLPEQIYCKEGCRGICPKCGADRNLINCDCDETEIDPRWAALKNLR